MFGGDTSRLRFSASPFLCFCRLSCPGSFLNQVRVHSFQDGFASLILHPRRQSQESNVRFGYHFTDFQFGRDRIPNEDRLEKAGGLFDKRDYGPSSIEESVEAPTAVIAVRSNPWATRLPKRVVLA